MLFWCLALFFGHVHSWSSFEKHSLTHPPLKHVDEFENVAEWGDAQHRGEKWYDLSTSDEDSSDMFTDEFSSESSVSGTQISSDSSSDASSAETRERKRATQKYRVCTPCPHEMLKSHRNAGIKWICAGYQRARRTFKSECMMRYRNCQDGTSDVVFGSIGNETATEKNSLAEVIKKEGIKTRKRYGKDRSTSSSSGEKSVSRGSDDSGQSLQISSDSTSSSTSKESEHIDGIVKKKRRRPRNKKKYHPKSSAERKGWRKWHRKCHPCPEEMQLKWKDPSIKWICGAYQQARRTFKSLCMMHLRNCQDGTMFIKVSDHRCKNDTARYGNHFFYDYFVRLSFETSKTEDSDSTSEEKRISSD